jgi:hypothetical protein
MPTPEARREITNEKVERDIVEAFGRIKEELGEHLLDKMMINH